MIGSAGSEVFVDDFAWVSIFLFEFHDGYSLVFPICCSGLVWGCFFLCDFQGSGD